tara:strand:- start:1489 stop:1770 length:282 start_codon:yes stop_codon:yes gene_type:complete
MKLMTEAIQSSLPTRNESDDAQAVVKYFTPDADWTWYATEYDPESRLFFGLVDGFERELGYFSLDELEQLRGPLGLPVERDLYWKPTPLSELA